MKVVHGLENICLQLLFSFPSKTPENLLVLLETYNQCQGLPGAFQGRRAVGNDESICNHQLLSLLNSSVLWEGW